MPANDDYLMRSILEPNAEIGDHLAQIYEKQGKKDDAIRKYVIALNIGLYRLYPAIALYKFFCVVDNGVLKSKHVRSAAKCGD